jgi:hypothetical protein
LLDFQQMKLHSHSIWQSAARRRWPAATMTGDGPLALVCPMTELVALYSWPMQATADAAKDHSNFHCVSTHQMVELQPEPTAQPVQNMADHFPD